MGEVVMGLVVAPRPLGARRVGQGVVLRCAGWQHAGRRERAAPLPDLFGGQLKGHALVKQVAGEAELVGDPLDLFADLGAAEILADRAPRQFHLEAEVRVEREVGAVALYMHLQLLEGELQRRLLGLDFDEAVHGG